MMHALNKRFFLSNYTRRRDGCQFSDGGGRALRPESLKAVHGEIPFRPTVPTGEQIEKSRAREIRAERNGESHPVFSPDGEDDSDDRTDHARDEDRNRDRLPRHDRADPCEKFDVSSAHAFSSSNCVVEVGDRPKKSSAGQNSVEGGKKFSLRIDGGADQAEDNSGEREFVGKNHVIEIDEARADDHPDKDERFDEEVAGTESQSGNCKETRHYEFDEWISKRKRRFAVRAFSAKPEPRKNRHVVVPSDRMFAGLAVTARPRDTLTERQSIDHDVAETAEERA
jgi:hypothetical protein